MNTVNLLNAKNMLRPTSTKIMNIKKDNYVT